MACTGARPIFSIPCQNRREVMRSTAWRILYVALVASVMALLGIWALQQGLAMGPTILASATVPLIGLLLTGRSPTSAIPDMVFGALDTGLLTIPALWGGVLFGVAGAIAGGVIGDALTDAIAGFCEGSIAEWLRKRGIEASREPLTTALGKMAGCLLGGGLVLTTSLLIGVEPKFGQ